VLPLLRQTHDSLVLEAALLDLGSIAAQRGDVQVSKAHLEESLASARASGHRVMEALLLHHLSQLALRQEAYSTARTRAAEGLAVARAAGDLGALCISLGGVGFVALRVGELATARRVLEEGVVLQRQIGERNVLAFCLDSLGELATVERHFGEAAVLLHESLGLHRDLGDRAGIAWALARIAALAAAKAQPKRAVQLAGAAANLREALGITLNPMGRATLAQWLVSLRKSFGVEATRLALREGRVMPEAQVIDLALSVTEAPHESLYRRTDGSEQQRTVLSPREQEVAALLADGLSNRQIAQRFGARRA